MIELPRDVTAPFAHSCHCANCRKHSPCRACEVENAMRAQKAELSKESKP